MTKYITVAEVEWDKLEAVYKAAKGVAINKGAARKLAVNILIGVVQTAGDVRTGQPDGD